MSGHHGTHAKLVKHIHDLEKQLVLHVKRCKAQPAVPKAAQEHAMQSEPDARTRGDGDPPVPPSPDVTHMHTGVALRRSTNANTCRDGEGAEASTPGKPPAPGSTAAPNKRVLF